MEKFPESFNRKIINDLMEQNQLELIKIIRNDFHEIVLNTIAMCEPTVPLEFPSKLWQCHRVTLIKELIERFGKVRIQTANSHFDVTKLITSTDDIPNYVNKVIIEFVKEN
ncbi:MAG: hypothetical protein Barrevirus35_6 [Barrevirus sp.]|uniref:Uncharacterized protein n=1 Tax=Barrevirus sp. TaxID=2487763 RepID=A0A3G4ZR00_9VIRU|nr:MAG: hypothetical protein Barrevirus35_6 [Barrevirus sp.]